MLQDFGLLFLLLLAIAIGWWLGRRSLTSRGGGSMSQYYRGLNYLLDEQPDSELDSFIESLPVNSETLETHIAVGKLMRRKGEVERAIRIHQNLLARPTLPRRHLHHAHLELALDFIKAGLFDRAERLLKDLIEESPQQKHTARRHLMEIYQAEKEWQKAIDEAKSLLPKRSLLKAPPPADSTVVVALSHYYCEMAEQALAKNNFQDARGLLKEALTNDKSCVRASLKLAEVEYQTGNYRQAIKSLKRVKNQDAAFVPETLERANACYKKLGDDAGFDGYLDDCLAHASDLRSVNLRVLLAKIKLTADKRGERAASELLYDQLKIKPSPDGLVKLIELHIVSAEQDLRQALSSQSLQQLKADLNKQRQLLAQLSEQGSSYQCQQCGFFFRQLHWLCLGCQQWGCVKPARMRDSESPS